MTIRKTKYVAASDSTEAWLRFQAKLYTETREEAQIRADEMDADDHCEPPCKYCVWEVHIDIHVDEGPEGPDVALPTHMCSWCGTPWYYDQPVCTNTECGSHIWASVREAEEANAAKAAAERSHPCAGGCVC